MQTRLLNLLHQTQYLAFETMLTLVFLGGICQILWKHLHLKEISLKLARLLLEMNEPNPPKRKPNVRSRISSR